MLIFFQPIYTDYANYEKKNPLFSILAGVHCSYRF